MDRGYITDDGCMKPNTLMIDTELITTGAFKRILNSIKWDPRLHVVVCVQPPLTQFLHIVFAFILLNTYIKA